MSAPVPSAYLGKINLQQALLMQSKILEDIAQKRSSGLVMGFELEPVVTLGVRGQEGDVFEEKQLLDQGYRIERVDRGGQATLHNPGQLVVFPVLPIAPLGVRDWICRLIKVTQRTGRAFGQYWRWEEDSPGLYDGQGKVVSIGIRVRCGVSTHGLAINVHNDLEAFSWIRACGREGANLSRLQTKKPLAEIFNTWCASYEAEVDKSSQVVEFDVDFCSVRS